MIRAKINAKMDGDLIHLTIEYVDVVDNQVGETQFKEEFKLSTNRPGCAYVSRVAFEAADVSPGTFWLDENGLRHFNLSADPGVIDSIGMASGLTT